MAGVAGAAVSCDDEYEPVMGDVSERIDAAVQAYKTELVSAPHGWMANIPTSQGVYRFWMGFAEDNRVTMYTDNLAYPVFKTIPKESSYRVQPLQRPTITFDTYSYLSILCDPDPDISGGSEESNQGLETDFEYEVVSYEDGRFELEGRNHRVKATLTMATAEEEEAVKAGALMGVQETLAEYAAQKGYYYMLVNGEKIAVDFSLRSVALSYVKDDRVTVVTSQASSYVDLKGNLVLEQPLAAKGFIVTGFRWDKTTKSYTAIGSSSNLAVKSQAEAVIGLDVLLGCKEGNRYRSMAFLATMYDGDLNGELARQLLQLSDEFRTNAGWPLGTVYFRFAEENGKPIINAEIEFALYMATFTFDIAENPNGTFTILKWDMRNDAVGNAESILSWGVGNDFVNYFVGKTFRKEWVNRMYGTYKMGRLTDVTNEKNYLIGALL